MGLYSLVFHAADIAEPAVSVGFVLRWRAHEQAFELEPLSDTVKLWNSDRLWTAEHVISTLELHGFHVEPEAHNSLFQIDSQVQFAFGDPLLVGDPRSGRLGLASPDGRTVARLPVSRGRFAWWSLTPGAADPRAFAHSVSLQVLKACAPLTFPPNDDAVPSGRFATALSEFAAEVFPAPRYLGLNVRTVQTWAGTAVDDFGPDLSPSAVSRLVRVAAVDKRAVQTAARSLYSLDNDPATDLSGPPARRARPDRPRSRSHSRDLGDNGGEPTL